MNKLLSHDKVSFEDLKLFSKIKLIAIDLDGTMVNSSSQELNNTIERLNRSLSRYKLSLTIATGRSYTGAFPLLSKISIKHKTPLILYNGSLIITHHFNKVMYTRFIEQESLQIIFELFKNSTATILVYEVKEYQDPSTLGSMHFMEKVYGWTKFEKYKFEFNGMEVDWINNYKIINKTTPIAILIDINKATDDITVSIEALKKIKTITITSSGSRYIEIRPQKSNKGIALTEAANLLKCNMNEVLALGDNDNDVEMLFEAGIGVALCGASQKACQASNYICNYEAGDVVIEVLRLIKQSKRYFQTEQ